MPNTTVGGATYNIPYGPNNPISPGLAGGLAAGGALAGAIPTPSSSSGQYGSNTSTTGSTASNSSTIQSILQAIQNFQKTQQTSTTTPVLDANTQAFLNSLIQKFSAQQTPSLTGYVGQGTQQINQNSDVQQRAVDSILASRGLATSPVAATADANIQANRINQITGLQEQAPLQLNALQLQNLMAQAQFLGAIPRGTTTTGAGTTTGGQTTTGQTGTTTSGVVNQTGTQDVSGFNNQQTQQGGGLGQGISGGIATLLAILPFL